MLLSLAGRLSAGLLFYDKAIPVVGLCGQKLFQHFALTQVIKNILKEKASQLPDLVAFYGFVFYELPQKASADLQHLAYILGTEHVCPIYLFEVNIEDDLPVFVLFEIQIDITQDPPEQLAETAIRPDDVALVG